MKGTNDDVNASTEGGDVVISSKLQGNTGSEKSMKCSDLGKYKDDGKAALQLEFHTQVDGNYRERGKQMNR